MYSTLLLRPTHALVHLILYTANLGRILSPCTPAPLLPTTKAYSNTYYYYNSTNILVLVEVDSPLVCALAVFGVNEDRLKDKQYLPILSAVIKIVGLISIAAVAQAFPINVYKIVDLDNGKIMPDASFPYTMRDGLCGSA
jgi:hypothetical protein